MRFTKTELGMARKLLSQIILLIFVTLHSIDSRGEAFVFNHYTSKDGLSSNYIHDITQDTHGYIWVATRYGVCRFDGTHFKNYFIDQYPSLLRNEVYHACTFVNDTIAFASSKGMFIIYDEGRDLFIDKAPTLSNGKFYEDVTGLCSTQEGNWYLSSSGGVYPLTKGDTSIACLDSLKGMHILEFTEDAFGRFWAGTYQGVKIYDKKGNAWSGSQGLSHIEEMINNILELDRNTLLLCSTLGSVWEVRLNEGGDLTDVRQLKTPFKNISEVHKSSQGRLWLGTSGSGLWLATPNKNGYAYTQIAPQNNEEKNLMNKITALFEDRSGTIWVGTQNTGLWRISEISQCSMVHSSDIGLPPMTGTSFAETDDGDILFGTDGHGLYKIGEGLSHITHFGQSQGLPCANILSLTPYQKEWIVSFWGGIPTRFDGEKRFTPTPYDGIEKAFQTTKSTLCDKEGGIWACMAGDGVYHKGQGKDWRRVQLLSDDTTMRHYPDIWINHACQSPDGTIWVITSRTIWKIDKNGATPLFQDIDKKLDRDPLAFHQGACDKESNLFVAASDGIYRFSNDGDIEKMDFLPKGSYVSILKDSSENLWTSGQNGIIKFSYAAKSFEEIIDASLSPDKEFFTERASFIDSKGYLWVGTQEGFIRINTCKRDGKAPYMAWSELFVNGERINVGSDILPQNLSSTTQLTLKHNETNFRLTFDIMELYEGNKTESEYRIKELNTNWISIGKRHDIQISHLPYGQYTIEARPITNTQQPYPSPLVLTIVVTPPWWATWWFRSLIVLAIIGIAALIVYMRFKRMIEQKRLLQETVRQRTQELDNANRSLIAQKGEIEARNEALLHSMSEKDQLISIVAHDLKNPMFAIVAALEGFLKKEKHDESDNQTIDTVYHSATTLQNQMIKLLDWATDGHNTMECRAIDVDLRHMLKEVISLLHGMTDGKKISISCKTELQHHAHVDPRMISTVLRNIITNAIKFTPRGKTITITAEEKKGQAIVSVIDSGTGMSEEQIKGLLSGTCAASTSGTDNEQGYGLGFRIIRNFIAQNHGELQIKSETGEGTTISILLPVSDIPLSNTTSANISAENVGIKINKDLLREKSILVIDDDPLILLHIKSILEPVVEVFCAHDGEEGIQTAQAQVPDLIVSDIEMPQMNGIEMSKKLKENPITSNIPLLFLSANNETGQRLSGLSAGAIDYITKPFEENELLVKICNIITHLQKQQVQALVSSYHDETPSTSVNPLLEQLLEVVKANYEDSSFSFDDIAKALNMSKSTLTRRLKTLTDKSPVEILSEYRLNKARTLLDDNQYSVSEVAYKVGFNDPLYFGKKFKETFGFPPSARKKA